MEKLYRVLDTEGHFLAKFSTFNDALNFKMLANRPDWKISKARNSLRKPTEKMLRAVVYIESLTPYQFTGNNEDFQEVADFIGQYLYYAKSQEEIYYDNMGYDDYKG